MGGGRDLGRLLEEVQVRDDSVGAVAWTVSVDSTINRAHQHAAGARKKGATSEDELEDPECAADRQALGRSRGGLTTKVHLACDGRGLPLAVLVTPGNVSDSTAFDAVLDAVRVLHTGVGRPRRRPDAVIADEAYSSRAIRQTLRPRGIWAVLPARADQKANACSACLGMAKLSSFPQQARNELVGPGQGVA